MSADLRECKVPGTSPDMLERMRLLCFYYPQVAGRISAPLVRKFGSRTPRPLPVEKLLGLSWTHLADLVRLDDPWKRAFYENECLKGNWSKRQLQRQIGSLLYERTGLSTDKQAIIERARQQAAEAPADIASLIRDPYVLEFTGLAAQPRYLVALPKPDQLQQLIETDRAVWEQRHLGSRTEEPT